MAVESPTVTETPLTLPIAPNTMHLQRLLSGMTVRHFIERYFHQIPYARAEGCHDLLSVTPTALCDRILVTPGIDQLVIRDGRPLPVPPEGDWHDWLRMGCTVRVRHAERADPAVQALADDFAQIFGAPIDVHLYATASEATSLHWHYDVEDVFVLQLAGSKTWLLRKNTVNPWPLLEQMPEDLRFEREQMPVTSYLLEAGGWLYVPNGYWHATKAGAESISLSVGVSSPTALRVFDCLRTRLLDDLRWRQRIPARTPLAGWTNAEAQTDSSPIFADLASHVAGLLTDPQFISECLRLGHTPQPGGPH